MRIARIEVDGRRWLARVDADGATPLVAEQDGPGRDPLREALAAGVDLATAAAGPPVPLDGCRLLAPVAAPQKILAIGLNYGDHAREQGRDLPSAPLLFAKTPNSLTGPGDAIRYSRGDSERVDYEAELAVVVGRTARRVAPADALDHVLGVTCANDVTARDAQYGDGQWVRGKSFDTFCPLGPWIVTPDEVGDVQALGIRCRVNGAVLQESSTADMIFGVAELVSYLSRFITLEPGDVICTGTPAGIGHARQPPVYLLDGDVAEVEIDGIGTLRNPVAVG